MIRRLVPALGDHAAQNLVALHGHGWQVRADLVVQVDDLVHRHTGLAGTVRAAFERTTQPVDQEAAPVLLRLAAGGPGCSTLDLRFHVDRCIGLCPFGDQGGVDFEVFASEHNLLGFRLSGFSPLGGSNLFRRNSY
ncbi:hypothetical protein D3C79_894330 [compost metagenome]